MNHAAFLSEICERPLEDLPRLAYADWLDEEGEQDRAEFIRTQLRYEASSEEDPFFYALEDRAQELLRRHERAWIAPLRSFGVAGWGFRRGLVEWVQLNAAFFAASSEGLFRLAPVREVSFFDVNAVGPDLARCPGLARLVGLDLNDMEGCGNRLYSDMVRALARSPHLRNLTALDLSGQAMPLQHLRLLLESPAMPALATLNLQVHDDPQTLELLARLPQREQLRDLTIDARIANPRTLLALLRSTDLCHLSCLSILAGPEGERLPDLQVFAPEPGTARLGELRVQLRNGAGLRVLARSPHLGGLRTLDLSQSYHGDTLCRALAGSPLLGRLHHLRLAGVAASLVGVRALASSPAGALRTLDLSRNPIGDDAAVVLAGSPFLSSLRSLDLGGCELRAEGAVALAGSPYLGRLGRLKVNHLPRVARERLTERFGERVRFAN